MVVLSWEERQKRTRYFNMNWFKRNTMYARSQYWYKDHVQELRNKRRFRIKANPYKDRTRYDFFKLLSPRGVKLHHKMTIMNNGNVLDVKKNMGHKNVYVRAIAEEFGFMPKYEPKWQTLIAFGLDAAIRQNIETKEVKIELRDFWAGKQRKDLDFIIELGDILKHFKKLRTLKQFQNNMPLLKAVMKKYAEHVTEKLNR